MKVFLGVPIALLWLAAAGAQAFAPSSDPVFQKMLAVNKGLSSYKGHIDVQTRLPLGSFTLHGTIYDRGDQSKVVFDNVPAIAKSSVENQPSIGPVSSWPKQYTITASHASDTTTYHLVPVASSGVRNIDAVVENASGLVQRYVWSNSNGMTITSDQTYESVGGYQLVQTTSTKTRGGAVHADSETTFTNYELNASIPDSIFTAKQ